MEEKPSVAYLRAANGHTINLVYGSNKIGRDSLAVPDKKVSRHHATIGILNPGAGQEPILYLEAEGANPCLVDDNILKKGEKCPLQHGSEIYFATEEHAFTFHLRNANNSKSSTNTNATKSSAQVKRKREEIEESKAPKKSQPVGDKKMKMDNNSTTKHAVDGDWDSSSAIAFPSFGTNTFEFDIDKAATVACEEITSFLKRNQNPDIRLLLLDLTESETLDAFRKRYKLDDPRFTITSGNIVNLKDSGTPCRFIANAANGGLFSGGGGINAAINKAAGPSLDKATKRKYGFSPSVKAGGVYPVQIPNESPLRQKQDVEWCFHVLAPNMNPKRPNCLHGDYATGCALLRKCYSGMLRAFEAILDGESPDAALIDINDSDDVVDVPNKKPTPKASAVPPAKNAPTAPSSKKPLGANAFGALMASGGAPPKPEPKPIKSAAAGGGGGWANLLAPYIRNPESYPPDVMYYHDEETVVIFDKYPKAFKHLLVMPRKEISLQQMTRADLPLLKTLKAKGELIVKQLTGRYKGVNFKVGFHAIPSMRQLHMHVISDDFDSEALKTKKHWNSFTTNFFIPVDDMIEILNTNGNIEFDKNKYEAMLNVTLRCHKCTQTFQTMPKLKQHIVSHA